MLKALTVLTFWGACCSQKVTLWSVDLRPPAHFEGTLLILRPWITAMEARNKMKQNETKWNKMKQNETKWKTNWTHPFRKFSPVTPAIVFHPFKIGHMNTPPMATCLIACHVLATMWSSCVLFSAYLTSVVARQNITRSHKRRYYRTVWVVWGIPMRIIPTGRALKRRHINRSSWQSLEDEELIEDDTERKTFMQWGISSGRITTVYQCLSPGKLFWLVECKLHTG